METFWKRERRRAVALAAYKRLNGRWTQTLGYPLNRARRSALVPPAWIADGRSEHYRPSGWPNRPNGH